MNKARWLASADSQLACDELARRLRDQILRGDQPPGSTLSVDYIDGLYRRSGIETTDTALARLVADGFVMRVGGRLQVPPLEPQAVRQAYRMRRLVEPELAAEAARRLGDREVNELENLTHSLIMAEGSPRLATAAAARMSRRLVLANPTTCETRILRDSWQFLSPYFHRSLELQPSAAVMGDARDLGISVVEAYRRQNGTAIRNAMRDALAEYERLDSLVFDY